MDKEYAESITDELLEETSGEALRQLARSVSLSQWETHRTVFSATLTADVVADPVAMAAVGKTVQALVRVYAKAGDEPIVENRYGSPEVLIWQEDHGVRASLRYARDRALKDA